MKVNTAKAQPRLGLYPVLGSLALSLMGPIACGPSATPEEQFSRHPAGQTGMALTLRVDEETDVAAIRFKIDRRQCTDEPFTPFSSTIDKPLEEIRLRGGMPGLENVPFDADSSHAFADLFVTLDAGCYDVTTQPLDAEGEASEDCSPASSSGIWVNDGQTREVLLINQCWGPDRGTGDIISALNHPPELVDVVFEDSKFIYQCTGQVVCATVRDPDGDPLEFVWSQEGGAPLYVAPEVLSTTPNADGSVTECIRTIAEDPGQYVLKVVAYDLLHDPAGTGLIRIEDFLAEGGTRFPSNDALTFPFYAASDGRTGGCEDAPDEEPGETP
ncbi:hypothetical protein JQX13_31165 [Archangium violaceum]|uniref:hypothetical protein n=1 Tax=Archangium violaceum TaxID=83451 RepID=UPI00193C5412|nr:hypothetical protein [Archangium violaceum]QRK04688.1 hypothetical protein JQX13_31165 [Archangium violaceum]